MTERVQIYALPCTLLLLPSTHKSERESACGSRMAQGNVQLSALLTRRGTCTSSTCSAMQTDTVLVDQVDRL